MNKILKISILFFCVIGCKSVYTSTTTETSTKITLNAANFKNLGHFVGVSSIVKRTISQQQREALISRARAEQIKAAGAAYQTGTPQIFINTKIEFIENSRRISCTVSGDLIEFL